MQKIIESLKKCEYFLALPNEFGGFRLTQRDQQEETSYLVFCYEDKDLHRKFEAIYDPLTKEFKALITVGLHCFFDMAFFSNELDAFEKLLKSKLALRLKNLAKFSITEVSSIFVDKKILEWSVDQLPKEVLGFQLFIKPCEPVKILNGSYIILDYSDFTAKSNLAIYYNVLRDEFFGEARIRNTPHMTTLFDTKEISILEEKVENNLCSAIQEIRRQLDYMER